MRKLYRRKTFDQKKSKNILINGENTLFKHMVYIFKSISFLKKQQRQGLPWQSSGLDFAF